MSVLSKKFAAARALADAREAEADERAALVEAVHMVEGAAFDFDHISRARYRRHEWLSGKLADPTLVERPRARIKERASIALAGSRVARGRETDCLAWAKRARKELGT